MKLKKVMLKSYLTLNLDLSNKKKNLEYRLTHFEKKIYPVPKRKQTFFEVSITNASIKVGGDNIKDHFKCSHC